MIGNGLTTWLADQLVRKSEFTGDRNKYEMYDLEYSLGLFMNLCQCQTAVRACGSRARNLFKSLGVFMTTLDVDVRENYIYNTRIYKKNKSIIITCITRVIYRLQGHCKSMNIKYAKKIIDYLFYFCTDIFFYYKTAVSRYQ